MDKDTQDTYRNLEGFRTDRVNHMVKQPTAAQKSQTSWFKKGSMIIICIVIVGSISWAVYAFSDRKNLDVHPPEVDQTQQTTRQKSNDRSGEAFHLKLEQKKTKTDPVYPPAHDPFSSKLSPPPQPKERDFPAKNDQPMEIPDHLKERIQREGKKTLEEKKK